MRILGRISTSFQCIKDGSQADNIHLKATVVQDIYQTFDTNSIAGSKLSDKLIGPLHLSTNTEPADDAPNTPKKNKRKKSAGNVFCDCLRTYDGNSNYKGCVWGLPEL